MCAYIYSGQMASFVSIDLVYSMSQQVHNWDLSIAGLIGQHFKCKYHHEDAPTTNTRAPEADAIKRFMKNHWSSLAREQR